MAKKITGYIKACRSRRGKPIRHRRSGLRLVSAALNIMMFCKEFNAATQTHRAGLAGARC